MSETKKETIWGDKLVEQAVIDYDKLRFYRVYPPSLPGDTAADCIHRAMVRMTGNSYFKNYETGEYDMISSDAHYQCFGTIPATRRSTSRSRRCCFFIAASLIVNTANASRSGII